MDDLGYGEGYKYAHDYPGNFVIQEFMPENLGHTTFWNASNNPSEAKMLQRHLSLWGNRDDKKK